MNGLLHGASNPTHNLESRSPYKGSPHAAYFQNSMTGRHVVLLVDAGEGVGGHDLSQPQNDLMAMSVGNPRSVFNVRYHGGRERSSRSTG